MEYLGIAKLIGHVIFWILLFVFISFAKKIFDKVIERKSFNKNLDDTDAVVFTCPTCKIKVKTIKPLSNETFKCSHCHSNFVVFINKHGILDVKNEEKDREKIDPVIGNILDTEVGEFIAQLTETAEVFSTKYDEDLVRTAIKKEKEETTIVDNNAKEYLIEIRFDYTWQEALEYLVDHWSDTGIPRTNSMVFWDNASRNERLEDLTKAKISEVVSTLSRDEVVVEAKRTVDTTHDPEIITFVFTIGKSSNTA